jgi:hypothetical protein
MRRLRPWVRGGPFLWLESSHWLRPTLWLRLCLGFTLALRAVPGAPAQLRVANWNVTNYSSTLPSSRDPAFKTALYGVYEGRSFAPDVLVAQELLSAASVTAFKNVLNTAAGSPGDWEAAPFVDGPDTDSALFYRTSKVDLLSVATISVGGPSPAPPRHTMRYLIRLKGYTSDGAVLALYSSHMKAGTTLDDQARRLLEAQRIRDNAETLPAAYHFLLGADLNIRTADEAAYVELTGSQPNDQGRFFDPIKTSGYWYQNVQMRFVHTQDPAGAGGMDDRFDQILMSADLLDGVGFDYIGDPQKPYSLTTWDDADHSYRAWGNDGTSFNQSLTVSGNQMVGPFIAQALVNAAGSAGHLPVFADLRVPARISSPAQLDFGSVPAGPRAQQTLVVTNSGDTTLWSQTGIATLHFSLSATDGFTAPDGSFSDAPGGDGASVFITMDTSSPGPKSGTVTILSDAPDEPVRVVALVGHVTAPALPGDVDGDGDVDQSDLGLLLAAYGTCQGDPDYLPAADFDGDGCVSQTDLGALLAGYGT